MNTLFEKERTLVKWKYLYYNGNTEVPDFIYDKLEDELRQLGSPIVDIVDCPNVETLIKYNLLDELTVGEKGIRFKHYYPMLSLRKFTVTIDTNYNEIFPTDIRNFFNKVPNSEVTCTPKFDGNSMELTYIGGVLNQALTRGNEDLGGGLDKTDKLKLIVPTTLYNPHFQNYDEIIIRGEVIIPTQIWSDKWSDPNKVDNPRNWLAGILNNDEINHDAIHDMHFVAYQITFIKNGELTRPNNPLQILQNFGFKPIFSLSTTGFDDFFTNIYPQFVQHRIDSIYALDGIVLNFPTEYWDSLGQTSHHPHYACAVKFPPNRAITILEDIDWSLGKDGEFTPVALFKPIELDGTMVKHASLHNLGWIVDNKVFPGCKVEIEKRGEIIPQLIRILEKSPDEEQYQKYLNEFIECFKK